MASFPVFLFRQFAFFLISSISLSVCLPLCATAFYLLSSFFKCLSRPYLFVILFLIYFKTAINQTTGKAKKVQIYRMQNGKTVFLLSYLFKFLFNILIFAFLCTQLAASLAPKILTLSSICVYSDAYTYEEILSYGYCACAFAI